jgi:PEP-CTERM motif
MKALQFTLLAGAVLAATGAHAGDFTTLPTTGALVSGLNNQNSDRLYLDATSITFADAEDLIPSVINYNAIATSGGLPRAVTGSGTLTLLASSVTPDVVLAGEEIGNAYDFVFRDSRDGQLVFGTRVTLGVEPDQAQDAELNFLYRYGFDGYSAAAAWLFTGNFDLRMYNAGRTASDSLTGATPFDAGTVRMQSDVNLAEGNPFSGLFLIKTDAPMYSESTRAIGVFQAGEEGQPRVGAELAGFVPSAVPEPSTYLMLLLGLAGIGAVARRRQSN